MDPKIEMPANPEIERIVEHAWLFDVDGVITDPQAKRITNMKVVTEIIKMLKKKEPVGLITGRTIDWLEERILHYFISKAKKDLSYFFVSAEKGGIFGFYKGNKLNLTIDKSLKVPEAVRKELRKIVNKHFSDIMFFDELKKTMISIEVIDGVSIKQFKKNQPQLDALILNVLKKYNLEKLLRIDSVRLSTDIEYMSVGKNLAARRFLDWLNKKGIDSQKFYAFGDSLSDVSMAEEVHKDGKDVVFVFVGEPEQLKGQQFPFKVIFTESRFEKGTLEYLSSHRSQNT